MDILLRRLSDFYVLHDSSKRLLSTNRNAPQKLGHSLPLTMAPKTEAANSDKLQPIYIDLFLYGFSTNRLI